MKTLTLVVAMDLQRAIGRDNQLPWHLRDDLKHFKSVTMGKPILMGRKTYESIGRPLPGRQNIVLSRDHALSLEGVEVVNAISDALRVAAGDEVMVIGGGQIYQATLPFARRIWRTTVQTKVSGADAWFPRLLDADWADHHEATFAADDHNDYAFVIERLERIADPGSPS